MLKNFLFAIFPLLSTAQIQPLLSFHSFVTYDPSAQGGTINENRQNDTILNFQVHKLDTNLNKTFICLKASFSLSVELNNLTLGENQENPYNFIQQMTSKTTLSQQFSNCETLLINWENDGSAEDNASMSMQFSIEESVKNDYDQKIFYLQKLQIDNFKFENYTSFPNITFPGETIISYNKEGPIINPGDNSDLIDPTTPVEAEFEKAFKCYFGFFTYNKNQAQNNLPTFNNQSFDLSDSNLVFNFKNFKTEMYETYSQDNDASAGGNTWKPIYSCDNDVSKTLPIIVGCVLAIIVIGTVGGYFVAKRRSRVVYEQL